MILIDTNILIDSLRGVTQAQEFIQKHGKANLAISAVVALELYQGCRDRKEFIAITKELRDFNQIGLNETITTTALQLSQQFSLSHSMGVADTLIAATALVYDLELRTANLKDFRFIPNIKVSDSLH